MHDFPPGRWASTESIVLGHAENRTDVDAGMVEKATVGGLVFIDRNTDGVQQFPAEEGLQGARVSLFDEAGRLRSETVTSEVGFYAFSGLFPDTYRLQFNVPVNFLFTRQGADPAANDSDADATGRTGLVTLAGGENRLDIGAGVIPEGGSVLGTAYIDVDADGVLDPGERGRPGLVATAVPGPFSIPAAGAVTGIDFGFARAAAPTDEPMEGADGGPRTDHGPDEADTGGAVPRQGLVETGASIGPGAVLLSLSLVLLGSGAVLLARIASRRREMC